MILHCIIHSPLNLISFVWMIVYTDPGSEIEIPSFLILGLG
jgi:hypothetical protein